VTAVQPARIRDQVKPQRLEGLGGKNVVAVQVGAQNADGLIEPPKPVHYVVQVLSQPPHLMSCPCLWSTWLSTRSWPWPTSCWRHMAGSRWEESCCLLLALPQSSHLTCKQHYQCIMQLLRGHDFWAGYTAYPVACCPICLCIVTCHVVTVMNALEPSCWLICHKVCFFYDMCPARAPLLLCLICQPGDCVIINAANSIVGRTLLQLCKLLKLRCVAVLRCRASSSGGAAAAETRFAALVEQLKALGATLVLKDEGSIKVWGQGLQQHVPHTWEVRVTTHQRKSMYSIQTLL